ncbi:MobV family relaxase [Shewanella litorisediminis]|uniref:MobV family relaxase n=1 Tax=Shewanella litorisediminis TaxID=1173586 RepID=UPI002014F209|nr:MobV family relaxase [Shewanella litorisediminis]MCL2920231.1 plasmid recombination protein [Shewanella litorisediminis]
MADFAVLRFTKIKSMRSLRGALAHNLRVQHTPNADPAKGLFNRVPVHMNSIEKCLSIYGERLGKQTPRKNAIYAHEAVVTGSPDVINNMNVQQQMAYFEDALKWLQRLHGGKDRLVSAVVHYDETTPHLQAIFIPIDDRGRLNSRSILGGHRNRLSELQTEFANDVAAKYGLHRGRPHSPAHHQSLREWYGKEPEARERHAMLSKELDALTREVAARQDDLDKLREECSHLANEAKRMEGANGMRLDALKQLVGDLEANQRPSHRPRR